MMLRNHSVKSLYSPAKWLRRRGSRLFFTILLSLACFQLLHLAMNTGHSPLALSSLLSITKQLEQHDEQKTEAEWEGYSIKPIAYVFPQFHAIPENDKFWGTNFTEWTNVKKITENRFGLETLHPTKEIGYYNLLDYDVRKRYAKLVRDSGIYGIAYHHYWFGYPVMDKPLQAMLEDGQPDVPFMLSWANEPWTNRWDGAASRSGEGTLLSQNYGNSTEWRRHFDWMAQYLRHPKYIRSGGKVQFMVYAPVQIGDTGKRMFAKWRRWAAEDPDIGGMDIIETLWVRDYPPERGHTDAINEFMPHSSGLDMTRWERTARIGSVYHRGAMVSWDNSPRHAKDGKGSSTIWVHPELWKQALIGVMRHIKMDPNPRGQENFLFINALNEWGEGNVLEPSIQWGSRFSKALRAAKDYADTSLLWLDDLIKLGEELEPEATDEKSQVDVCVIIRDFTGARPWSSAWQLQHTLWSLQAQHNPRWRAVVVPVGAKTPMRGVGTQVLDTYDPRIIASDIPKALRFDAASNSPDNVTDWVVENLDALAPSCAKATYMLVTDESTSYEPHAFDVASRKRTDIIGLNFVSPATMALQNARETNLTWDERCVRYIDKTPLQLSQRMVPGGDALDLSAALVNLARWRRERLSFKLAALKYGDSVKVFGELEGRAEKPWAWARPTSATYDVIHADTYPSCTRAGYIWFDGPDVGGFSSGCYSGASLASDFEEADGHVPTNWDYARFKTEDPFCVRLSEERYREVLAGEVEVFAPS